MEEELVEEVKFVSHNRCCRNCGDLKHGDVPCIIAFKQREAGHKFNENWKDKYCLTCLQLKHDDKPHEKSTEIFIKN